MCNLIVKKTESHVVQENVRMTTDLPTNAVTATNISPRVLIPTRWRQKSTGMYMEQNYVSVCTLYRRLAASQYVRAYDHANRATACQSRQTG